jgi:hypothetical protein
LHLALFTVPSWLSTFYERTNLTTSEKGLPNGDFGVKEKTNQACKIPAYPISFLTNAKPTAAFRKVTQCYPAI